MEYNNAEAVISPEQGQEYVILGRDLARTAAPWAIAGKSESQDHFVSDER
jgi:hypothetical protein